MSYKDSLRAITETGDWTQWISFFLDAAIWQADSNYNAAKAIMEYYARTKSRILEMTSSKYAIMLLDAIFSKPVFTQTSIGFEEASRPTVFTLLKKLEEAGIIARISDASGRTGAVYDNFTEFGQKNNPIGTQARGSPECRRRNRTLHAIRAPSAAVSPIRSIFPKEQRACNCRRKLRRESYDS